MKRYEIAGHARYLTFSCYQRLPLFLNDSIKQVFVQQLIALRRERPFVLLAWVLMPEHVHLLLAPDVSEHPVAELLHALKRPVAERVLRRWKELDAPILCRLRDSNNKLHFWQTGGGYDRNVWSDSEVLEKINYIHANPVRRGLVDSADDWPWSSARWYSQGCDCGVRIDPIPW